jgi:hypothetical protein
LKNSIVLLELIFSIVLFSIVALITTDISYNLYRKNSTKVYETFTNLKLETTRLFLVKHGLSDIKYRADSLYFGTDLLLDNISSYESSLSGTIATIAICIDENSVCQQWKIRV